MYDLFCGKKYVVAPKDNDTFLFHDVFIIIILPRYT